MRDINEARIKYYEYLEDLRKSGITNMFGASPYLFDEFDEIKSLKEATSILCEWMDNYTELSERFKW